MPTVPHEISEYLDSPEAVVAYLNATLDEMDDDPRLLMKALRNVVETQGGVTQLSIQTDLDRVGLSRALSGQRYPKLDTLTRVIDACGLKLRFETQAVRSSRENTPNVAHKKQMTLFGQPAELTFVDYGHEGGPDDAYGRFPVDIRVAGERALIKNRVCPETWAPNTPPPDRQLRRYMSHSKFRHLLASETLFFALVESMEDQFEGFTATRASDGPDGENEAEHNIIRLLTSFARRSLISCWSSSKHESNLMWKQYGGAEGVAIETTADRLHSSIVGADDLPLTLGEVAYVDAVERNDVPRLGIAPLLHKRKEFGEEQEVRAILPGPAHLHSNGSYSDMEIPLDHDVEQFGGRYMPVNLNTLIGAVVVAPNAPDWFVEMVESDILTANLDAHVVKSALDSEVAEWTLWRYDR